MTAMVSNPPSGLSIFFEDDAEVFQGQAVNVSISGSTLEVTLDPQGRRRATSRLMNVAVFPTRFGKTRFETEVTGNTLLIFLDRPIETPRPARTHVRLREHVTTDADIANAVRVINSLNREDWRVYLDTTNNSIKLRKMEDFA